MNDDATRAAAPRTLPSAATAPAAPDRAAPADPTATHARDIIGALIGCGVRHMVICPGSRNAPLTYAAAAAARAGLITTHVRVDERSAGFFALGLARGEVLAAEPLPVAVITTSGTAVANLHPALAEADATGIPLLAVTADRPAYLRGTGANQTTQQAGMFATVVRAQLDIPAFGEDGAVVANQVWRAVARALGEGGRPGPAHLNICLDGNLAALPAPPRVWPAPRRIAAPAPMGTAGTPWPEVLDRELGTVIVAGDATGSGAGIVALAGALGWPLLAEPSSPAAYGPALSHYVYYLTHMQGIEQVLLCGHPTLSRPVTQLLKRADINIVAVADRSGYYFDPFGTVRAVLPALPPAPETTGTIPPLWRAAEERSATMISRRRSLAARTPGAPFDPLHIACTIWDSHSEHPESAPLLFVGASASIRILDRAARTPARPLRVLSNRGLAGIDGTISCARGLATATGEPVRVLLGDLTFLHDMGGLLRGSHEPEVDLQVIVLNDAGGSIFAGLEHGEPQHAQDFGRYFATPQRCDIEYLAYGMGADYLEVRSLDQLDDLLARPIRGVSVVEVRTDIPDLRARDAQVQAEISAALGA
ncbi:2-succinyl-5-enolpyruvyl-6-hydroxy-3-cyclohexene-1-carboxylic-acid synthase [Actinotignum timonense]|nr:2-succinyl-5-enolpyruvyl-6-hydroxy-3-cyclohexene-1-carboxylic-acid synthase [Actinotignum timonense]